MFKIIMLYEALLRQPSMRAVCHNKLYIHSSIEEQLRVQRWPFQQCVIMTEATLEEQEEVDEYCRRQTPAIPVSVTFH